MSQLYEEMKESLKFFGLSFSDTDKVTVAINNHDSTIVFTHGARKIELDPAEFTTE